MANDERQISALERTVKRKAKIIFCISNPMKRTLQAVAARNHTTLSDLIRDALLSDMKTNHPEYDRMYQQYLLDEVERMA